MHKIPGLSEYFVAMDDDFVVLHPMTHSDFFALPTGKPLVLASGAQEEVPIYDHKPHGPDMPPKSAPTRMRKFQHVPCPVSVSFAWQLENTYPDWFAFVRSHHTRFVCCNATIRGNGVDEEFHRVYPHMLLKLNLGIHRPVHYSTTCEVKREALEDFARCFADTLKDPRMKFMTLQNIFNVNVWHIVQKAMQEHVRNMPDSKFVAIPLGLHEPAEEKGQDPKYDDGQHIEPIFGGHVTQVLSKSSWQDADILDSVTFEG